MWSSLKQLIKSNERFIIIEDGEPKYVIMPYSEYKELSGDNTAASKGDVESINSEMQNLEDLKDDVLRLEDLPF